MQHRFDVFHADTLDQDFRRAVVTHGHHHRGQVTERQARYSGRQAQHNVAAAEEIFFAHQVLFRQLELRQRKRKRFIIACAVYLAAWRKGK